MTGSCEALLGLLTLTGPCIQLTLLTLSYPLASKVHRPYFYDTPIHWLMLWINAEFLLRGIICGPPAPSTLCHNNLDHMLTICDELGFATNPRKTVQPCTQLELLGVELDSVAQEARITETRLGETIDMLYEWRLRSSCTKRQLQSLIGKLNFICSVCRPGRTFLRRMIDLLQNVQHPSHHIRLGNRFLKDLNWWLCFYGIGMARACSVTNNGVQVLVYMPVQGRSAPCLRIRGFATQLTMLAFPIAAPSPSKNCLLLPWRSLCGLRLWRHKRSYSTVTTRL